MSIKLIIRFIVTFLAIIICSFSIAYTINDLTNYYKTPNQKSLFVHKVEIKDSVFYSQKTLIEVGDMYLTKYANCGEKNGYDCDSCKYYLRIAESFFKQADTIKLNYRKDTVKLN